MNHGLKCNEPRGSLREALGNMTSLGRLDNPGSTKSPPEIQAKPCNQRAIFEVGQETALAQIGWLLGDAINQASIAQQFAAIGDPRGKLYCIDSFLKLAARAGAEGIELRKLREEIRQSESRQ
jgi:hypothetical protein